MSVPPTSPSRAAPEALALRRWALATLARPAHGAAPPAVSAAAWDVFLRVERCALALAEVGRRTLRGAALDALRARVMVEAQRVLAARAQLADVADAAARNHWKVAALKGAVPLVRGGVAHDLLDLDLWASPGDARALVAALDAAGFAPEGAAAAHRLEVRAAQGMLPLEVHTTVPTFGNDAGPWTRLQPAGPVWTPAPADHAWLLLLHATEQHPDRRGRIRELLLLGQALEACTPAERAELARRAAGRSHPQVAASHLRLAAALARREGDPPHDPFELTAATGYLLAALQQRIPLAAAPALWHAASAAAARRQGAPGESGATLHLPSAHPALVRLRRVAPGVERLARRAVRAAAALPLAPAGWLVAAAAARAVKRQPGGAPPQDRP